MTVVRDHNGNGHAVLTVKTDRGEYILDNQTNDVLSWADTGYRFVKRQSQSDPNVWVSLGEPRAAPATASSRCAHEKGYAFPVTSPPLPVPRPGSRRPASPKAGRIFLQPARGERTKASQRAITATKRTAEAGPTRCIIRQRAFPSSKPHQLRNASEACWEKLLFWRFAPCCFGAIPRPSWGRLDYSDRSY